MAFTASDVVPLTQARATLSDLVEQVKAGAEKIITKNGESYVAIIDSQRLDYYHRLERERIHLLLIDDASKVKGAHSTLSALKRRRAAKAQA
jgi:prevent-host-death family protein